jgi:catechol 2,3-dioxygenase-like lactoylglutathione lyase family enzyme
VSARLDHVTICASDFAASLAFYDAALSALGLIRSVDYGDEEQEDATVEAAGYGRLGDSPSLWLVRTDEVTHGVHVSLRADSRAMVEAFYAAGAASGGRPHDAPRRWAIFRRGEFNAVVADPDGNRIEAVSGE